MLMQAVMFDPGITGSGGEMGQCQRVKKRFAQQVIQIVFY